MNYVCDGCRSELKKKDVEWHDGVKLGDHRIGWGASSYWCGPVRTSERHENMIFTACIVFALLMEVLWAVLLFSGQYGWSMVPALSSIVVCVGWLIREFYRTMK